MSQELPPFSISQLDLRFLTEVDCLLQAGAFGSYRELAEQLGLQPTTFRQIELGKYHCNVKMLYLLSSCYPEANIEWVLFGQARTGQPEPTQAPVRERGRPVKEHQRRCSLPTIHAFATWTL